MQIRAVLSTLYVLSYTCCTKYSIRAVLSTDADAGLEELSVLLYAYVRDCTRAYLHAR